MFACQECGRKFRTAGAAERAASDGCPGCGGVDIDLDPDPPAPKRPACLALKLRRPFFINSRLLPALTVGDGEISLERAGHDRGRAVYRWHVDIPAGEFSDADLSSGACRDSGLQAMFLSLLSFLSACGESYASTLRTGRKGEHLDLFPTPVAEWAYVNDSELAALGLEIEETPDLIEEQ
jgi:hypothetical protein